MTSPSVTRRAALWLGLAAWWLSSAIDGRWGQPYSLRILTLPALFWVARLASRRLGILAAAIASAIWFELGRRFHPELSLPTATWEAASRFGAAVFFLLVVRWLGDRESQQRSLAERDELTALLNRRGFLELAQRQLKFAAPATPQYAVLMLDLNGFKSINDQHGHAAGDRLLVQVARAIRGSIRQSDLAARWGGDEFVVFLPEADASAARTVATRIQQRLEATQNLNEDLPRISVSIGASCDASGSLLERIAQADGRLLEAKAARPSNSNSKETPSRHLFDPAQQGESESRTTTVTFPRDRIPESLS